MDTNPIQRLSSVLLNEFNYLPWSRAISLALGGRGKIQFIQKDDIMPEKTSQDYAAWVSQDQLIMSWLLNSMEPKMAEIFSYSVSSHHLWISVRDMYGDLNNAARVFQLKKDLTELQKGNLSFVQHLGNLKAKWNELDLYRPHTTDTTILLKRAEEDKVFQLLASIGPEYEDLKSHLLMTPELPTFQMVCNVIQREEIRKKVMNAVVVVGESDLRPSEARAFTSFRPYKGKRPDLKCSHCVKIGRPGIGHIKEKCWILHPELKPKFNNDGRAPRNQMKPAYTPQGNLVCDNVSKNVMNSSSSPITLINEFANFLQQKQGTTNHENPAAMLGKFAGFLEQSSSVSQNDVPGIVATISTALDLSSSRGFWIVDSGASDHMTNDASLLNDFQNLSTPSFVSVANGTKVSIVGIGKLKIFSSKKESLVMHVPSFPFKLLSVGRITQLLNCLAIFSTHCVIFQDRVSKETIGKGFFLNGLYYVNLSSSFPKGFYVNSNTVNKEQLWHMRLAHPSSHVMSFIFPSFCKEISDCEVCQKSKSTRLPFPHSLSRATKVFEIVHSDIWGPATLESFDGYRFFISFIDDFSRTTFVYLLKFKHEAFQCFKNFHNLVQNHFNSNIGILRSDNGSEYSSKIMTTYLSEHGILQQTSCVGTPQQNGISERKNRDLLEKTRSLMLQANLPKKFWSQAIQTAAYIINRLPSRILKFKSPCQILKGRDIDISHLRVFGCVCYVHIQTIHRDKLDPRAIKCAFVGYSTSQKGYKCYDSKTRKVFVSRDVRFDETHFFFQKHDDEPQGELSYEVFPTPLVLDDPRLSTPHNEAIEIEPAHENMEANNEEVLHERREPLEQPTPLRRNPSRNRQPPVRLDDFEIYMPRYPIGQMVYHSKTSPSHAAFVTKLSQHSEPRSFEEANQSPIWRCAMLEELKALEETKTWSIVSLPKDQRVVGARWIYKTKFNSDGTIQRHKARLVARGFTQTYGVDYKETFAPVAKMNTVRVLLSVAINSQWSLHQMDVKNAFLHGELEEEVYMRLPPGHEREKEQGVVCKLHKAIYGLKQSPRAWYSKLSSVFMSSGFKRSNADSSMFTRLGTHGRLVVLVYVDDLIVTGDNPEEINALKATLHSTFSIKDLGRLRYFLGIEMDQSPTGLFLNQQKYVLDLLEEANMMHCKPAKTPLPTNFKHETSGIQLENVSEYQRLVGKLIYLTITRPDIAYAVSFVSQFMHSPTSHHLQLVKRILRYLKSSMSTGIFMQKNGHFTIEGYTDSDWAGNVLDRKSTTGYCTLVGGNLVTWKSKKQSVVARSSAEAEYRAMASTACELIWLKSLLHDLDIISSKPILLHCDNQAAMHIAANPVFHERTKHIEVDCHFVRNQVQSKLLQTAFVRSSDQLADVFTKPLPSSQLDRILFKLGSRKSLDPA
ncbi:hypothetical protein TB2_026408 [Malus domestica]